MRCLEANNVEPFTRQFPDEGNKQSTYNVSNFQKIIPQPSSSGKLVHGNYEMHLDEALFNCHRNRLESATIRHPCSQPFQDVHSTLHGHNSHPTSAIYSVNTINQNTSHFSASFECQFEKLSALNDTPFSNLSSPTTPSTCPLTHDCPKTQDWPSLPSSQSKFEISQHSNIATNSTLSSSLEFIPNISDTDASKPISISIDEVLNELKKWDNAVVGYVIGAKPPYNIGLFLNPTKEKSRKPHLFGPDFPT